MKKITLTLIAFISFCLANAQPPSGNAKTGDVYGGTIGSGKMIKKAQIKNLESGAPITGQIQGKVIDVCDKKGCWIKMQLADKSVAMVNMKDYGFFVPTALKGKKILVDGQVELATTSVKDLKHYAEDAKKTPAEIAAITEPKDEIKIVANGIRVVK